MVHRQSEALAPAAAAWGAQRGDPQEQGGGGCAVPAGGLTGPGPFLIAFILRIKAGKCLPIVLSGSIYGFILINRFNYRCNKLSIRRGYILTRRRKEGEGEKGPLGHFLAFLWGVWVWVYGHTAGEARTARAAGWKIRKMKWSPGFLY